MFLVVKRKTLLVCVALLVVLAVGCILLPPATRPAMAVMQQGSRIVVIDAGHGGEDGGAVAASGAVESGINLAIAQRLNALLQLLGEETVMIRTEDVSIYSEDAQTLRQKKASDLKNRVALVNGTPGAVLISIH
ncbi:MAG: N-acetylmuramoyl-L-alanine amidase, partial [Oscillospiraceae bacterium]|nr:N-acetylmuramoyl-L-alanine amidase [Oscillospiraceae bacterium]